MSSCQPLPLLQQTLQPSRPGRCSDICPQTAHAALSQAAHVALPQTAHAALAQAQEPGIAHQSPH